MSIPPEDRTLVDAIREATEIRKELAADEVVPNAETMTVAVQLGRIADVLERWERNGFAPGNRP